MPSGGAIIVGVTGPDAGGAAAWLFTRLAVWWAGGRAVRVTPRHPRAIDELDALILGGGADVDPKLYGQEILHVTAAKRKDEPAGRWLIGLVLFPLMWLARKLSACCVPKHGGRDEARDALETALLAQAVERRLPVLGICRGEQLLNVHFGGSLHQDVKSFYIEDPEVRTILPRKRILVEENSCLARAMGARPCRVNALHRQAIDQLGGGLRVAARDRNGIVQAIEHGSQPFVLGVQWHPEYLPQMPRQRALFRSLVAAAAKRRAEHRIRTAASNPPSPATAAAV